MTQISDERLAAMIESHVNYVTGAGKGSPYAEILSALLELQKCRDLLSSHYDECSGIGCHACIGYADLYPDAPVGKAND